MPTPSNSFLVMEDSNQELPVNLMKSVAIEVPTGNHNRPGVDPRELLAEIRRLSRRVEALEEQLASEPPDEEDVLELTDSAHETKPNCSQAAVSQTEQAFQSKEMLAGPDPPVKKPNNQKKKKKTTPVHFEASAWNIPLVIGLADVGWVDALAALLLIAVNVGMQIAFSAILLSEPFMGETFDENVDSARIWRRSVAHDDAYVDLAGTSLVSRVCALDGALILSNRQADLMKQINAFLGIRKAELLPQPFQPGVLLCVLCILLWTLCVYKELRSVWLSLEATMQISKARRTTFENGVFHNISYGRYSLLLLTYAARATIASVLLAAGILWLARTTSIQELMLNAVALNAILDVDEFLFSCLTPIKIQHVMQSLEPMHVKYSRKRSQCETLAHFAFVSAAVVLAYFLLVGPLTETMLVVKRELCGGNQSFVVSYNRNTQVTHGFVTAKAAARDDGKLSVSELAVKKHIGISPETTPGEVPDYILFSGSRAAFDTDRQQDMNEQAAAYPFCIETQLLKEGALLNGNAHMQPVAEILLRNAGLALGYEMASSCAQLRSMCNRSDAALLRLVCGETCGCVDPLASPWYKVTAQGCSTACLHEADLLSANVSCEDDETGRHWEEFWRGYEEAVSGHFGDEVTQTSLWYTVNQTIQGMLSQGCAYLHTEPQDFVTGATWCEGMPDLFKPLASICPQTCGCSGFTDVFPSYCGSSCNV
ncbi:unnamed protein product [Symbiodinium microadriaticum]|nr:unnamed protein product [Symbiodinium microadriaticum]